VLTGLVLSREDDHPEIGCKRAVLAHPNERFLEGAVDSSGRGAGRVEDEDDDRLSQRNHV
jgi:hypothetical protein